MKKSCAICGNELSRKWQSPAVAKGHAVSHVLLSCGVCGASFTRAELQASAKPPAGTALLPTLGAPGSVAGAESCVEDPRSAPEVVCGSTLSFRRKS